MAYIPPSRSVSILVSNLRWNADVLDPANPTTSAWGAPHDYTLAADRMREAAACIERLQERLANRGAHRASRLETIRNTVLAEAADALMAMQS